MSNRKPFIFQPPPHQPIPHTHTHTPQHSPQNTHTHTHTLTHRLQIPLVKSPGSILGVNSIVVGGFALHRVPRWTPPHHSTAWGGPGARPAPGTQSAPPGTKRHGLNGCHTEMMSQTMQQVSKEYQLPLSQCSPSGSINTYALSKGLKLRR